MSLQTVIDPSLNCCPKMRKLPYLGEEVYFGCNNAEEIQDEKIKAYFSTIFTKNIYDNSTCEVNPNYVA